MKGVTHDVSIVEVRDANKPEDTKFAVEVCNSSDGYYSQIFEEAELRELIKDLETTDRTVFGLKFSGLL